MILRVLYALIHGTSVTSVPPKLDAARSFAARMSHLVPLLANCPGEPTGADALDVLEAYHQVDPDGKQSKLLISYAHFADLMPEVRRDYFSVVHNGEQRFTLHHASTAIADAEAEDILLSELALGFQVQRHPFTDELFDRLPTGKVGQLSGEAILAIKALGTHYLDHAFEVSLVDDNGLRAAVGVTHEEFRRFRAALLGMAVFSSELAKAFQRRLTHNKKDNNAFEEWLYWLAPTWGSEFFRGYLITESRLADEQVERLLSMLSVDFRAGKPSVKHARDGYFPPVWQLPGMLLLCADPVLLFTQLRNLLFSVQCTNKKLFDDTVSRFLEPALVTAAQQILAPLGHLDIRANVDWTCRGQKGEIDLLVFHSAENVALHIQAKAPLPPQGARLVQRLEDRLDEGLSQLKRFRLLPEADRDEIISKATGRQVRSAKIVDAVLARSCFGTQSIREKAGAVKMLTLPILAGAASDCASVKQAGIEYLLQQCLILTEQLLRDAEPHWDVETLTVDELELKLPLLQFDEAAVARLRLHLWRDNMSLGIAGALAGH
jgi:hypothetical protein